MIKALALFLYFAVSMSAQTIIYNAKVYTVNDKQPWAEALVYDGDKIIYVGENEEAKKYKHKEGEMLDAQGKFLMPGIIDAHTHTAFAALVEQLGVSLVGAKGKKEILSRIKAYKIAHPDQKLYTGVGFYPYAFGPKGPTKDILDEIFPDSLVFFISNNGHQAWVNSKTLTFLGIDKQTKDPLEGIYYYQRDGEGNPTGFLVEGEAMWPHFKKMGIATTQSFYQVLLEFLPQLSKQGITTLFDAGIPSVEEEAFKALRSLEAKKLLPLDYKASHFIVTADDARKSAKRLKELQNSYNSKRLGITSIKFINDNSDDDNFGVIFKEKELETYLEPIVKENLDFMIHTSQDTSVHQALNVMQRLRQAYPQSESRMTLAHVNMVRDSDFKRFKELGVVANIQAFNAVGGGYYEYRYMLYNDLWEHKLARFNHFFNSDVVVSASSDYPVCGGLNACTPFHGIQIGVTRQKIGSDKNSPILESKKERLTIQQMLKSYTLSAAYQLHKEATIGSLEIGKDADIIMLDHNPLEIDIYDMHKIKVMLTVSKGKTVYKAKERSER